MALSILALLAGAALVFLGISGSGAGSGYGWLLVFGAVAGIALKLMLDSPWMGDPREPSDEPGLNARGSQLIGRAATVETAVLNGRGKVRVGDTLWPAEGSDAPPGTLVRIKAVNGTVLVVEPSPPL